MNVVSKIKLPDLKKKKTKVIIALILVAVVCTTWFAVKKFGGQKTDYTITEYTVNRGDIEVTITGSGSVEPIEQYNILGTVDGDILNDYFEEGQEVKKGDLLYSIETGDLENSIQKAQNTLTKAQLNYEQSLEDVENLYVKSPIDGVITSMTIEEGDSLSNGKEVATILNTSQLKATLPFNASDAKKIRQGDGATVIVGSSGEKLSGTVSNVSSGQYITSAGALVSDIEIKFGNPGVLQSGETVSAIVGDYACNSEGTVSYQDKVTVTAKVSGEVSKINLKQGDKVSKNDVILVLENESLQVSASSAAMTVQDAELSLQDTYDKMDNYNITTPIEGKVIEKKSKAGDTLSNSNSSTTMAVVADMSKLTFTINVDELDISKIEEGQEVTVTADALEGETFAGYVDNISIIGTSSNGVTTYPVDIVIADYGDLLPGMNVNAEIIVDSAENVLMVPVSAVQRGNYVLLKDSEAAGKDTSGSETSDNASPSDSSDQTSSRNTDETGNGNSANKSAAKSATQKADIAAKMLEKLNESAPEGYTYVSVTIGLNDEDYIEIQSGLSEGDTIAILSTATATSANTTTQQGGMGMGMAGGGGEPPSGGGMEVRTTTGSAGSRNGG